MPKDSTQVFSIDIINVIIECLLITLILFSPLIYGSVTILPLSFVEATSFLILFIFLFRFLSCNESSLIKFPALPIFFFFILVLFTLFPLPKNLLNFLSPFTLNLYQKFMMGPPDRLPLSIYSESTLNLLLQLLSYLVVFFVVLNYVDTEKKRRRLILWIIISGFLYSFYGVIQRLAISGAGFSTFTNRNHFSAYIQMIIPIAISCSLIDTSKSWRPFFIFMASVMILALFFSLSRAGVVCFTLSLFLFLFLLKKKRPISNRIIVIIILVLLMSIFLGIAGSQDVIQRLKTLLSPLEVFGVRFNLIKDTLKIVKDFPLWGTGFGTLGEILPKYKSFASDESFSFTHNEPIQLLAETGILGFLFIFLFLFKYFKNIFSLWFKRHNPYAVYITLGCLAGLFSVILHSLFDFVFHIPANSILFFIILALTYQVVSSKESAIEPIQKKEINLSKYAKTFFVLLLCSFFIFVESLIFKRYQAESIFQGLREKKIYDTGIEAIFEYKKLLRKIDKSIALNPLNSSYLTKKADLLSELALREDLQRELQDLAEFKDRDATLRRAEQFYKKAIDLNPSKSDFHLRLGWLYSIFGNPDLAEEEFKKAILLDPQNVYIRSYIQQYVKPE